MRDLWGTSLGIPRDSWNAVLDEVSGWLAEYTSRDSDLSSDGQSSGRGRRAGWMVGDGAVEAELTEPWQGVSLVTQVMVRRQAEEVLIQTRLKAHSERATAVTEHPPTPGLLWRLHDRVGLSDGSLACLTTTEKVKLESVDEFFDELRCERRRLPVVVISPLPWTGEPMVDSDRLAQAVAFRAHVRLLDDAKVAWALSNQVGRSLSAFGGAVRVYWPGFSAKDQQSRHRFWSRQQIEHTDVVAEIRAEVESGLLVSIPDHQRLLRARAKRDETSERRVQEDASPEWVAWAESILSERDELASELKRTQRELGALQTKRAQRGIRTVLHAVEAIAAEDQPNLVLLPEAFESARQNGYQQPDRVLNALEAVGAAADLYASNRLDGGFQKFFQLAGYQFANSVSFTAATKRLRDYERTYEGQKITLGPHLKLGTGSPDTCLRIYWWVDEHARKLVIGHVGRHLPGVRSG